MLNFLRYYDHVKEEDLSFKGSQIYVEVTEKMKRRPKRTCTKAWRFELAFMLDDVAFLNIFLGIFCKIWSELSVI